mgnify:FL=1
MFLTIDQQYNLVEKKLATKKINTELNLVTFKYAKKVMYDYMWDGNPDLLECRGHTYCLETGDQIVFPPSKSFNYLENDTWKDKPLNTEVTLYKKYNGFMACVSVHHGKVIVSTTGSTSGPYVEMAKELIFKRFPLESIAKTWGKGKSEGSWLFEICHKNDPHIVHEVEGAYYLGYRHYNEEFLPCTDVIGQMPVDCTLGYALDLINVIKHEGFMMYDNETDEVCKLKSPYYVGKKKLMRMTDSRIEQMFANPNKYVKENLPKSWDWWSDTVKDCLTESTWKSYTEQERRHFIEEIENA